MSTIEIHKRRIKKYVGATKTVDVEYASSESAYDYIVRISYKNRFVEMKMNDTDFALDDDHLRRKYIEPAVDLIETAFLF
jgi:hypothetical protein